MAPTGDGLPPSREHTACLVKVDHVLAGAGPYLGAAEKNDAALEFELAVRKQFQPAVRGAIARFRIIDGTAFPLGRAAGEAVQNDEALELAMTQLGFRITHVAEVRIGAQAFGGKVIDRKSTRLNSSH